MIESPAYLKLSAAGSDWTQRRFSKTEFSPLGCLVANILGYVWAGIYHLDFGSTLDKVDWSDDYTVSIVIKEDLATWDSNRLTVLVVACHDAGVRMSIEGCGPRLMRLRFHQRHTREGSIMDRHPTIEEAVAMIRRER